MAMVTIDSSSSGPMLNQRVGPILVFANMTDRSVCRSLRWSQETLRIVWSNNMQD